MVYLFNANVVYLTMQNNSLDEWLSPNHQYRCEYIAHFNKVMDKYELVFIPSEQRIVDKMASACFK
jgi:uncharacterized protein (DUF488 family)